MKGRKKMTITMNWITNIKDVKLLYIVKDLLNEHIEKLELQNKS